MTIRQVKEEDIEGMANLYKEFWNEGSCIENMKHALSRIQKDPNYIILNAIENKKVVGTITGIICHHLYGDCSPFIVIENFIVGRFHRRKGIGKELLNKIEFMAERKKCCQIQLITDSSRRGSQKFYEAMGFPRGIHKGYKKEIIRKEK
jgi:ribosomal protein S18 acetylase RimI-like enzyme